MDQHVLSAMNMIAFLLVFALLTAALYGLYAALLRWLHTPLHVTGSLGKGKPAAAESPHAPRTAALRSGAVIHAFSR